MAGAKEDHRDTMDSSVAGIIDGGESEGAKRGELDVGWRWQWHRGAIIKVYGLLY